MRDEQRNTTGRRLVVAMGIVVALASACGGSSSGGGAGKPVVVYSSFPLQGPSRPQAQALDNGARLALRQAGGKAGAFKVVFKPLDDSVAQTGTWDPSQTTANARKAVQDPRGVAYLGEYNSGATALSLPVTNSADMPQITVSSSVGLTQSGPGTSPGEPAKYYPSGRRTLVRVSATDNVQGQLLAQLVKGDGCSNLAVVDDREVFGEGLAKVVVASAHRAGLTIVDQASMDKQAANYRGLASGLSSKHTSCFVFTGCTASNAVQLFKDVAHALPSARLYGSDCVLTQDFYDPAKGGLPDAVGSRVRITAQVLPPEQYGPRGRKVFADYTKTFGDPHPDTYAIYGYELMELALQGLKQASHDVGPKATIAKIRTATRNAIYALHDYHGALGTYSVTPTGDLTLGNLAVYRIKNGAPQFESKQEVRP